ncbi:hypothetical protein GPJ56_003293 [Histomonas meleagridis]|uniref:uncharacterized protein n=1 Tax=Histomonas meleagridis TaxID=135588 RepID=UPI00355A8ABB|nr:hypothetical protein GPJ56_003293 [Histomonas meleagridis]KAH0805954.1 hypothetical protein GO595_001285 [Histomonas meleagridis]
MENEKKFLRWLSNRNGKRIGSILEAQKGEAICRYLCKIAGLNDEIDEIKKGETDDERKSNYELAMLCYETIGIDFYFDIEKLSRNDITEFKKFAEELMTLDEEEEDTLGIGDDENDEISILLDELDMDLANKLNEAIEFKKELDSYGTERDFYLSKLLKIESICSNFSQTDSKSVMDILRLSSNDFQPVKSPNSDGKL